jgi:hypothetical protein
MSVSPNSCPECGGRLGERSLYDTASCRVCSTGKSPTNSPVIYYGGGKGISVYTISRSTPVSSESPTLRSVVELDREIVFTIRMRRPAQGDRLWTVFVDGPDCAFDVGVAESPDEALLQVIDTIALHDYEVDDGGDDDLITG